MSEIKIDRAEALARIIANVAHAHRLKIARNAWKPKKTIKPLWSEISQLSGYGSAYSAELLRMHGINPETGALAQ